MVHTLNLPLSPRLMLTLLRPACRQLGVVVWRVAAVGAGTYAVVHALEVLVLY